MKVVFIQPPSPLLLEDKVMPPLGIMYLASWLRKFGHDASIIDLAGLDNNSWKGSLGTYRNMLSSADWIGITATTPQYGLAMQIKSHIKQSFNVPIVVGGIHTTSLVHANEMSFLETDGFDSYCIGEGYNAVTKMCEDLAIDRCLKKIYSEPILKDVNDLPFAARDLIDIKSYKYKLGDTPATTFYSQYGCVYACSYCESPMAGSYTVRAMTPQRIQDEVRQIRDEFGIHGIMFFDDELNLSRDRFLGICEKLKELGDIVWRGFLVTAPSKNDEETFKAMKESGCYECATGIESGSPAILRNIRKPATVDINRKFVITAKRAGLRVKTFLIIGLPGESWQTIRETDRFLESLKTEGCAPDDVDFSILQVYKGGDIYIDKKYNKRPLDIEFKEDYEKSYYKSAPGVYEELVQVRTSTMSELDLIAARNYLENKWKPSGWVKDHTDRKDWDRVVESISYAEKKVTV